MPLSNNKENSLDFLQIELLIEDWSILMGTYIHAWIPIYIFSPLNHLNFFWKKKSEYNIIYGPTLSNFDLWNVSLKKFMDTVASIMAWLGQSPSFRCILFYFDHAQATCKVQRNGMILSLSRLEYIANEVISMQLTHLSFEI